MASFLSIFIPLVTAIIVWYANERSKRRWEQYVRKEENYKQLVRTLRGFYVTSLDSTLRNAFVEQVNLCWLYCPDEVIQKAYAFLSTVHTSELVSDEEKN
jgi:Pyruvate/2-oxoacid:ferredoxin oxidoreductase delta subunit